jgi:anti-sigma B factor antagonist
VIHSAVSKRPYLLAEIAADGDRLVIRLIGELDVSTARHASDVTLAALQASEAGRLDVDLSALTFCDSTGIRTLMALQRSAAARGGAVRLVHPQDRVRRIFEAVGLDDVLVRNNKRPNATKGDQHVAHPARTCMDARRR